MKAKSVKDAIKSLAICYAAVASLPASAQTLDVGKLSAEDSLRGLIQSGKLIQSDDPATWIPNRYIVVLKNVPGLTPEFVREQSARLSAAYGVTIRHVYENLGAGFLVEASPELITQISTDPLVSYIARDRVVAGDSSQAKAPYQLDRIDQRNLPLDNKYNYWYGGTSNTVVYIVDTGIRFSHKQFNGRAKSFYDWFSASGTDYGCSGFDNDGNGHGTHVAGIVGGADFGVAKSTELRSVRVLNCSNSGSWSGVRAGLDAIAGDKTFRIKIANLSIGGAKDADTNSVVESLVNKYNTVVVVAAGNENQDACNVSPASEAAAITVGAVDSTDKRWLNSASGAGSNFGGCVDIFAPGAAITSASNTNDTGSTTKTGTSMAAPVVAGVATLYWHQFPQAKAADIIRKVIANVTADKVIDSGANSPNRLVMSIYPETYVNPDCSPGSNKACQ